MLYYVMRPDNANVPDPVFTRYGRMGSDPTRAARRAQLVKGRLYATNGHGNELVADFWAAPPLKREPTRPFRQHQRVMAEAALFGHLVQA